MAEIITSVLPILEGGETYKVTSPFGTRADPITGKANTTHKGIDLVLWKGWSSPAPVCAAWDGTVINMRDDVEGYDTVRSAGNYVIIDHGDGLTTRYYHLAYGSVKVQPGDTVQAGEAIGYMGSTGYSTGAHLHFQLEMDGVPVDPLPFITGDIPDEPYEYPSSVQESANAISGTTEGMDNTPSDWAREAVTWAIDGGILYGDENGDLKLHDPCTREMMLVFLYRAMGGGR
jgi:hypothetical protein